MTNAFAIRLGLVILGLLALDWWLFDSANLLFLARKFSDLLNWIAFWR